MGVGDGEKLGYRAVEAELVIWDSDQGPPRKLPDRIGAQEEDARLELMLDGCGREGGIDVAGGAGNE